MSQVSLPPRYSRARWPASPIVILFALLQMTALTAGQEASRPPALFSQLASSPLSTVNQSADERQRRSIAIDPAPLGGHYGAGAVATRIDLTGITGTPMIATLLRLEETASGRSWIGRLEGIELSHVVLTIVRGSVAGLVTWPGGHEYRITPQPGGTHALTEVDTAMATPSVNDALPVPPLAGRPMGLAVVDDNPSTIDLLAVYSPEVRQGLGTEAGVAAALELNISDLNQTLSNSGINARVRLASMREVSFAVPARCETLLDSLTGRSDGVLDEVHAMRDAVGADLVYVFFTPSRDCSGMAWLPGGAELGFGITVLTGAGGSALVHEVGHNLGALHDWYIDDSRDSAKGYVNCAAGWKDRMSYTDECLARSLRASNIPYFSTPRALHQGAPVGVPVGTGFGCRAGSLTNPACDADSARTIAANVQSLARYRTSRFGVAAFPPRNEAMDFRAQLETKYRDGLRRLAGAVAADPEGSVVWTTEYMRYRLGACTHAVALDKVLRQIRGQGLPEPCGGVELSAINFPGRDQTYAFRVELERVYRDELRRGSTLSSVDPEGDVVWIQEYLRFRLNGCNHPQGVSRVMSLIDGVSVPGTCS